MVTLSAWIFEKGFLLKSENFPVQHFHFGSVQNHFFSPYSISIMQLTYGNEASRYDYNPLAYIFDGFHSLSIYA